MTLSINTYKARVHDAFSRHAASYNRHAGLQAYAAEWSAQVLSSVKSRLALPDGPILEVGCGTGLFSSKLLELFPERTIVCSDISSDMLDACRLRLSSCRSSSERVEFKTLDAEYLRPEAEYALIASSFALQWFFEPIEGLARSFAALKSGGILMFSVPGSDSCPEWKRAAEHLGIPFTRNPLLSTESLRKLAIRSGMEFRLNDRFTEEEYPDAISMLRSLKELGATTQRHDLRLSCTQLRKLLYELDRREKPVVTSYQVIAGYFRRLGS
jgi:malonyl-CoA O-methyltransferase